MTRNTHLEHIKNWASQDQTGLSARRVADAVVRMCDDAIAAIEAHVAQRGSEIDRAWCPNCDTEIKLP